MMVSNLRGHLERHNVQTGASTDASEKRHASMFRMDEDGGKRFVQNACRYASRYKLSHTERS